MDIVMVPGFWLDGSSWAEVTPPLVAAGHRVHPVTLPGLESAGADRSSISLRDHVDAVTALVDSLRVGVVLVGHSGGGATIHGVVDARPDRVRRAVYVDCGPTGDGDCVNDELPVIGGEIPLPPWSSFDVADLADLDEVLRAEFRARAIPEPRGPAHDAQVLHDARRYDVPATVVACEFPSSLLREWIASGHAFTAELGRIHDVEFVDLPTGHWPQFTRPTDLADVILHAVDRPGV
ncbi:esterase [Frondihabitans sucicola]|uniref:Esterase n=1 Tax=Frondihabitans sucicola TaxID=1268041 RepID=A0ABN6Y2G1_9MICO|nr:alpha/beta hydrolase [Frondihabitans sucicola]BDZ51246.1 esterase [Frondihabitans sucicola]